MTNIGCNHICSLQSPATQQQQQQDVKPTSDQLCSESQTCSKFQLQLTS